MSTLDRYTPPPYIERREGAGMSHLIAKKPKLLARVRRLRGQIDAVERALESEIGCADVLMLVASMRGAINASPRS